MKKQKKEIYREPQQLQLELPDYSEEYYEWKKKQEIKQKIETVIVIDI